MERRRTPRHSPEDLGETVSVIGSHIVNIGRDGLMLEAPIPLAPESTLRLRLLLDGERTDVDARVRGCVPRGEGRRRSWGVGLQFVNLSDDAQRRLDRILRSRPKGRA